MINKKTLNNVVYTLYQFSLYFKTCSNFLPQTKATTYTNVREKAIFLPILKILLNNIHFKPGGPFLIYSSFTIYFIKSSKNQLIPFFKKISTLILTELFSTLILLKICVVCLLFVCFCLLLSPVAIFMGEKWRLLVKEVFPKMFRVRTDIHNCLWYLVRKSFFLH